MKADLIALAEKCHAAAYTKAMSFPDIVGALIAGGFDGYAVDYRRDTTIYFLPGGENVVVANSPDAGAVAAAFDQPGIAAQIKWAQANPPDYAYAAFCKNVKALGCAGYVVSFLGRRVLYYGRTAETHIEPFPAR